MLVGSQKRRPGSERMRVNTAQPDYRLPAIGYRLPAEEPSLNLWTTAALLETLVLVGGLMWIMSGPGAVSLAGRVVCVALVSVCGGGAIAYAAAKKGR